MIDTTLSALISFRGLPTQGATDTALYVVAQAGEGRRRLQDSYAFGMGGKGAFDELFETFKECREPNWDGYGALPINAETYRLTYEFLEALPLGAPAPSIGAEPDGHLTVEWYQSPQRTLSVSVSPDGELHFAALIGASKTYGTEPFIGEVPKIVCDLIHRVIAA